MAQNKLREALDTTVEIVNMLGVSIPRSPKARHILAEKLKTKWALRGKAIESLIDLPRMTDPVKLAALQLLSLAVTPAYFTSPALFVIIINKMVALSVVHGNTPVSSVAYVFYAMLLCITPDTIDAGYRFGRLALQLRDRFHSQQYSMGFSTTSCSHSRDISTKCSNLSSRDTWWGWKQGRWNLRVFAHQAIAATSSLLQRNSYRPGRRR